jgi:major membrane immunogen (membrane-anchored lipoprotein)
MMKKYLIGSALTATLLLVGCGSSSDTVDTLTTTTGYLVDSPVQNVDYDCITDGDLNKITGSDGAFTCRNMNQVRFRIGELVLGEIDALPADGYVLPQDLVGANREQIKENANVMAMAQLLQSLDEDGDPTNGIKITEEVKALLEAGEFTATNLTQYLDETDILPERRRTEEQAFEHLRSTMQGLNDQNNPIDDSMSILTQDLKDAIAHMGNEERLAYDVYMNLYDYHNENNGIQIMQLQNIAQNAEKTHVGIMQALVQKYDLGVDDLSNVETAVADNSVSFEDMPRGEYDIPAIQELYDFLYDKGIASQQAALEVGCMVEVVDIDDLDEYIELAEESNAKDVLDAFIILRDGSYSHYWAFDKGLKSIDITDGCASLGEEYDHPEYPQNSNGNK